MADRSRILTSLERERTALVARYRAFDPDVLDTPCTRSEDPDGRDWTPRDHLAHLLRIEVAFLGMARATLDGDRDPLKIPGSSWEQRLVAVHRANEEHVDELGGLPLDELLDRLELARRDTLVFIAGLNDEQLDVPIPGAPWGDGSIGSVLRTNAYHERQHVQWVDEGLAGRR
ncbi:MAG: DinB family protein [Actinomycetota bacterium]